MTEFDRVWPWLDAALEHQLGGHKISKEEIWHALANREAELFSSPNSALITEDMCNARRKIKIVWIGGGSLKELVRDLLPQVEARAREQGFDYISGCGRHVWGRVLQKHGFEYVHSTFAKDLNA